MIGRGRGLIGWLGGGVRVLEEETIRAAVDRYVEVIRSKGGEPGKVDRYGRPVLRRAPEHRT